MGGGLKPSSLIEVYAYDLGYTLRMKTLFRGCPVMVNDMHTRRRLCLHGHTYPQTFLRCYDVRLSLPVSSYSLLFFSICVETLSGIEIELLQRPKRGQFLVLLLLLLLLLSEPVYVTYLSVCLCGCVPTNCF